MAALPIIRINSHAEIRRETITEGQFCVVVDDFLQDPHEIVEFADHHGGEFSMPEKRGYPGLLFDVNDGALTDIYRFIRSKMKNHFPFLRGGMNFWTKLSMVTLQPNELSGMQRFCHTDPNPNPGRTVYAGLVYLFENESLGGTGFYRWNESGGELRRKAAAIELENPDKAVEFLQEHFPSLRKPACYMTESNEIAELLCSIPARFNRLIFYSGRVPHGGAITAPNLLSTDFREGRLTLNVFADVLPK